MRCPRSIAVLCLCLALGVFGSAAASGQIVQGTDQGGILGWDPADWTSVILDPGLQKTITFKLNPCEWIVYNDSSGAPKTCLPRVGICSKLPEMAEKLEEALDYWREIAPNDGLTLDEVEILGDTCPTDPQDCPAADGWTEDGEFVVTRTYIPEVPYPLPAQDCPGAATPARAGGACLRFYDDPSENHTERWVTEGDVVYNERGWDTSPDHSCRQSGLWTQLQCEAATTLELVQETGHCFGAIPT